MNANMIHTWLKDPRFVPVAEESSNEAVFLPVEIDGDLVHGDISPDAPSPPTSAPLSASRVDITLSDGRRILIEGPTALTYVVSLVQGLAV